MTDRGFGAALFLLGGGSKHSSAEYVGKLITEAQLADNSLLITFDDGIKLNIYDDAQSCCEKRWMSTDDDVGDLVGKRWKHAMIKDASSNQPDDSYGSVEEIQFLEIMTEDGTTVTFANHNEHNGYYGGFGITIDQLKA